MPIYEYRCNDCKHSFEAIVNGKQKAHCPKCLGEHLEKQFSTFAVNTPQAVAVRPCGTCGDPRGTGACSLN